MRKEPDGGGGGREQEKGGRIGVCAACWCKMKGKGRENTPVSSFAWVRLIGPGVHCFPQVPMFVTFKQVG